VKMGLRMRIYLKQMRIKSWLKNLFVFSPIIFSLELLEWNKFLEAIVLTLAFCLTSSAIYVLNDISDLENDRKHNVKKNRPIASGQISIPCAWALMICLTVAGVVIALLVTFIGYSAAALLL